MKRSAVFFPLHILSATKAGATITLKTSKPCEVDTVYVSETTFYGDKKGIQVYQADGTTEVAVTSATLTDSPTISVVCAADPGASAFVRIAQQPYLGGTQGLDKLERASFRVLKRLGQSIHNDGTGPVTFFDYIMNQEVVLA